MSMVARRGLAFLSCLLLASLANAQTTAKISAPDADLPPPPPAETLNPAQPQILTEAEQITRLQRTIASDAKRVDELRCEVADPSSDYHQAEAEFRTLDDRAAQEKTELTKLIEAGEETAATALKTTLAETEMKRQLARARFDLAIKTRKTLQEQIAVLESKLQQDQLALDKLTGVEPKTPPAKPVETPLPPMATVEPTTVAQPAAIAPPTLASADATGLSSLVKHDPPAPPSRELIAAKQSVDVKKQAADAAEQEVRSVTDRLAALEKSVTIEQKLLAAARQKSGLAKQTKVAAEVEYKRKSAEGLMGTQLAEIATRRADSERLLQEADGEVHTRLDRLQELQTERVELQREQLAALQAAKQKQDEAAVANARLGQLKNPFSLQNIFQWFLTHGPTLAMIVTIGASLYKIMQLSTRRVVDLMVQSSSRSPPEENEARVNTLVGVFQNAATMTIVIGGGIMFCEEAGVAVAPLMGGAAVLGLAVAFGAQNLIRDYFYGFVILLENQYKINDVLKIGEVSGQVERITLRMTVLRDLEGCVHFIPNGKIDCVTNMTHGWSRAVFDIGISHKEDADSVMNTLLTMAADLRHEPAYSRLIIDDPEMLGVDKLDSSGVTIKFLLKTRPLKQWAVKRELLRRIKRRFTELGIETSMPTQLVLRAEGSGSSTETLPEETIQLSRRAA
ncbi:mechanosensitive ion channel domain-containing protein [Anatilimnocola floriformis]|uniref:mechanosensitive ion channel domain-containing protein n=1 Tax=Anatilimnocola floriformis TaxID=2948575 RepID=UPI0020C252A5|nr:mechanosensitive ion channel domain-containing protein [Anatilimnocola floriformis]